MRSVLLAVVVLVSGCTAARKNLADVEPLPPERHTEPTLTVRFHPNVEPKPDDLWVCGFIEEVLQCADYEAFMKVLHETADTEASL